LLLALGVLLAGCSAPGLPASESGNDFIPDRRPLAKTMVYDCNGYEFIARLGPGEMAVWLPDRYLVLSQVRAASGAKYREGDVEFWSKGDDALLLVGNQQYLNCTLQPHRVPWEDARRRGVAFRATGNEPGWYLEIQEGRQLLFVAAYGSRRVVSPDPGVQAADGVRTWHAITESADLLLDVVDHECVDSMSGEVFTHQVTLILDSEVFHGCGRDLDYPWQ
jgi:putative lipoprotein